MFSTKTSLMLCTIVRNLSAKKTGQQLFYQTGRGCAAAALRLWLLPDSDLPPIEMCGEKALNEHWQYITQVGNVTGVVYLAFFIVEVICETGNLNASTDCRNVNFIKPFPVRTFCLQIPLTSILFVSPTQGQSARISFTGADKAIGAQVSGKAMERADQCKQQIISCRASVLFGLRFRMLARGIH